MATTDVDVLGPMGERFDEVLTQPALELVVELHRQLDDRTFGRRLRARVSERVSGS